ncbi:CoA transferase [Rhodococcus opacus]|nr:CoA transferase [Rhodococcus opacus]
MLPLSGVRVVEIAQFIAVPGATQLLVDLGAEVIKVEPPGGEASRRTGRFGDAIFSAYNRGKHSVVLDLRDPADQERVHQLIAKSDVVVHNMRQKAAAKSGLDTATLRSLSDRIVIAHLSGFGVHGANADRPGFDVAAQAESGMMSITGEPDGPPLKAGFALVDAAAGYVLLSAVVTALFDRERTGTASEIEVSLLEVAIHLQGQKWADFSRSGEEPVRTGNQQQDIAPASDVVAVANGEVVISAYMDSHFARLCDVIGAPSMATDPRYAENAGRVANRPSLIADLTSRLADWTVDECVARLTAVGVVCAGIRSFRDVAESEWAEQEGVFVEAELNDNGGSIRVPGLPFSLSTVPKPAPTTSVPSLGGGNARYLSDPVAAISDR